MQALLLHRAAYSFVEPRTINATQYSTFQEAAAELGLFEIESEGKHVMKEEVKSFCSPKQLQFLFPHTLLNLPVNAIEFFNDYQEHLLVDYLNEFDYPTIVVQKCLLDISCHLSSQSAQWSDFSLPEPESKVDKI